MGHFCSQIDFLCILFVPLFMLIFGIALGRPPVPILRIWGSFQGAFWGHFEHFFADVAKLTAKCLIWEVLGVRFCIYFAYFLNVFFMLLSRWPFCAILAVLGLPKGSLWELVFADFANFACKNDMLDLKHENEAFLALIWRGRRQWGGLPESSDSAEHGEWIQSRLPPPAGVRRIL